ncbi:hypothetical protein, partial [Mesorhizobium sp.]|uniref:hypothetical protein n=1 Tax=Mesorhizobium sp. TaxID=1871066 RepID=UPI0025EF6CCA
SPYVRVFDRLIDTSCSSPTEFQFGAGRRNLLASPLDRLEGLEPASQVVGGNEVGDERTVTELGHI